MKKKIELFMAICLIFSAVFVARESAVFVLNDSISSPSPKDNSETLCIVIDAGHGGSDPGKIGVNDAKEKDINLELALKLKNLLEEEGFSIILTRDSDEGLYPEHTDNKKAADMQMRCQIITEANPVFTVSLHQNSYPSPEIKGAQVFYYEQSEQGKKLAESIQKNLIEHADPQNTRSAKSNDSYYLLKKTPTPTVIVECGFLSNPTEADLLLDSDYQDKLTHAVFLGILEYLNTENLIKDSPSPDE